MKRILAIGHNDLRLSLRDKTSLIWLILMPLGFVYFTSFSSRPQGDPWDTHPPVRITNLDTGFMGSLFIEELGSQGLRILESGDTDTRAAHVTLPTDLSEKILTQRRVSIDYLEHLETPGQAAPMSVLTETHLVRAIIAFNALLLEHASQNQGTPPNESSLRLLMLEDNPVVLDSRFAGRNPIPVGFNMSLPGILVMYLLMNLLIYGGATMAEDRRNGLLRRLTIHPISKSGILLGKLYGLMLLGTFQIVVMLLFGQFVFHVNIGDNLAGIAITLLLFSWVASSLGILIGSVIHSADRVIGVAIMISIPMAALSGCWWPIEIVPPTMRTIALLTPSGWAMNSLHGLITYGHSLMDVAKPLGMISLFGLASNLLAARFFRV